MEWEIREIIDVWLEKYLNGKYLNTKEKRYLLFDCFRIVVYYVKPEAVTKSQANKQWVFMHITKYIEREDKDLVYLTSKAVNSYENL